MLYRGSIKLMLNKRIVLIAWCVFAGANLSYAADKLAKLSVDSCAQVSIAKQDFTTHKSLAEDLQRNIKLQNDLIFQLKEYVDSLEAKTKSADGELKTLYVQNDLLGKQITAIGTEIRRFGVDIKFEGDEVCFSRMSRVNRSHLRMSALRKASLLLKPEDAK